MCVELRSWGISLYSSEGAVLKKLQHLRLWGFACRSLRSKLCRLEPSLTTVPLGAAVRGRRPCRGAAPPVPLVTLSPPRGRQRAVRCSAPVAIRPRRSSARPARPAAATTAAARPRSAAEAWPSPGEAGRNRGGGAPRPLPDRTAPRGLSRSPRRAELSSRLPCRRRSAHTRTHSHTRRRWLRGAGFIFPEMMSRAWEKEEEKEEDGCSFS